MIDKDFQSTVPTVVYRLPGEGNYFRQITEDPEVKSEQQFVFSPFEADQHPSIRISGSSTGFSLPAEQDDELHALQIGDVDASYIEMLAGAGQLIQSQTIEKVVLARRISSDIPENFSLQKSLVKLAQNVPNALVYALKHPLTGTWMGATPEILLEKSADRYYTMALAGTRHTAENRDWTDKELHEQQVVSDFIENELKEAGAQDLRKSQTTSAAASHLEHLRTQFTCSFDGSASVLVDALHPTPATCGLPREKALENIRQLEPFDRKYYCGYLGPVSASGDFKFFVNLRCAEIDQNQIHLYAGGGITAGSVPEAEWRETELKAHTLLKVL